MFWKWKLVTDSKVVSLSYCNFLDMSVGTKLICSAKKKKKLKSSYIVYREYNINALMLMITGCCVEGSEFNPETGSPRIFKIDFHQ